MAIKYRQLTGKPLGITGEIAEFSAAKILDLDLADARQPGYDAIQRRNGKIKKIQIKGRCIPVNSKSGRRLGKIQLEKEWDVILFVMMNENLDVTEIYEADRPTIKEALISQGSKARNEKGTLTICKFISIGHLIWKYQKLL